MREDIEEILTTFFKQVEVDDHSTNHYPSFYSGLELKVGFGFGHTAKIPWITFLGPKQTPQEGIFPVFYFFKENHKLILAYGISETHHPRKSWLAPLGSKTITQYFKSFGITPYKYGLSYIKAAYSTYKDLDYTVIKSDLDSLIEHYKKLFQPN
jgi:5-methylcytosine-specific restriction enzyme B